MILNEFRKEMNLFVEDMGITFTERQIEQFFKYMNLLLYWNEKINLTAIVDPKEIIVKHFIDSVTLSKYIPLGTTLVDVGTGAGFPGIPLKILRDDIDITLLDSLQKRISFLNIVIEELNFRGIRTMHSRVEEFSKSSKYREKYDIATSRAVANMSTLAEYLLPNVKVSGEVLAMKGSSVEEELSKAKNAISILGGEIQKVEEFKLPKTDIKRSIVVLRKIKNTPPKYPRKAGIPAKEPIG